MPDLSQPGYAFARFRLEPDGILSRGQKAVPLAQEELAALRFLLARAGRIVTSVALRHAIWGNLRVADDSVSRCLLSLCARLEPDHCIQTVYKRGYRFSEQVRRIGEAAAPLPRLAIMPFEAARGFPQHLALGVVDETIARLANARPPLVDVLASDSVSTLARRGLTAQQLGRALKAHLVLTGSLRALPSHYRLRAEMTRVDDGAPIWVEDLLVQQSRIAGLESEMAGRLLYRLGAGLQDPPGLGAAPPLSSASLLCEESTPASTNANGRSEAAAPLPFIDGVNAPRKREAYEHLLQARAAWQTLKRHDMQDGLQLLFRAIELDPDLIQAHVDIVRVCVIEAIYGFMPAGVAADHVRRTAQFLEQYPGGIEAILPALGWISFHVDRDLPAAIQSFSRCAHLPADPWTTRMRVFFAMGRHRFAEAVELTQDALRHDPVSPLLHGRLAWALHLGGRTTESLDQLHRSLALFPGDEATSLYGSVILAMHGDPARGVELAQDIARRQPYLDTAAAIHAYTLAAAERKHEARAVLERLQWMSRERFVARSFLPAVHVALGDHQAALADLRTAESDRCPWFFQMLADPRLKPLREYPEFERMRSVLTQMEAEAAGSTAPSGT
jgi:DNA-binding winged helix-turn-helix (wHTH) protein